LITLTNKLPSKLKQLTIINSTVSELNVLTPLTELQTLEIINSSLTSLPSFATGKTKLQNLILVDSNVSSLSNFHNLPALMLLHIENCPITATPIMTASTELRYMRFINCDFLLTVNALSVYTKLIQLEVSGKIISVFGVPLTVNTQLESISITETNIQTLPSFSTLTKLNYVDLSFNNLTVDAIKDVVAQISAAVITTNGTLNISNQQQYIDYENLGQTYKDNVDILKTNKQWTVIAKLDDFTYI
jgi:Leucine-rich repeat (LRR) protein